MLFENPTLDIMAAILFGCVTVFIYDFIVGIKRR